MSKRKNQTPAIDDLFAGIASAHADAQVEPAPESHLAVAQLWLEEHEGAMAHMLETCHPSKRDRVLVLFGFRVRRAREFRDHVRASQRPDGSCGCRYCVLQSDAEKDALVRKEHAAWEAEELRLRCLSDGELTALARADDPHSDECHTVPMFPGAGDASHKPRLAHSIPAPREVSREEMVQATEEAREFRAALNRATERMEG